VAPEARSGPRPPRPPRTGEPTYQSGDKVQHPTFGTGIVIGVRSDATTEIVDVNFAGGAGIKKLDVAFAPLTKV
jgi:ATP-dependent DNA helicase UvrD/PcrA